MALKEHLFMILLNPIVIRQTEQANVTKHKNNDEKKSPEIACLHIL